MRNRKQLLALGCALGAATVIAACGGGGGGGGTLPGPNPSPSVAPSPTPALNGTLQVATGGNTVSGFTYTAAGNAQVVFSCGCSSQAGTGTADGTGSFTLTAVSTPTPSAPNPTYTIVPTRNYVVIGTTSAGEAWNMDFAGSIPSHNLSLASPNDVYAAAATLYVYQNSPPGATAFDAWNFNTVLAWLTTLHASPNAAEIKLLNDIAAQSGAHATLFPTAPGWNPSQPTNALIKSDITAVVASSDATKPTPCPGAACTGTPAP
ncbi:MAG: hypothetical protein M3Z37_01675 [Candidatus Eremiobacteraeota bacterium]|nr:hypothetical protein [Candidatus Eremiobacteraeota bacterium]